MEQLKTEFLARLAYGLRNHQDKDNILREYEAHLDEILIESFDCTDENELMRKIVSRMGSPEEILAAWQEELEVTPSNMKWLFILLNVFLFICGSLLTLVHNMFQWSWLTYIWNKLTSIPMLIAFLYLFFWALLGYEIGRGFGYGGRRLLKKTFLLSLIPNLVLMILTVFEVIP